MTTNAYILYKYLSERFAIYSESKTHQQALCEQRIQTNLHKGT